MTVEELTDDELSDLVTAVIFAPEGVEHANIRRHSGLQPVPPLPPQLHLILNEYKRRASGGKQGRLRLYNGKKPTTEQRP